MEMLSLLQFSDIFNKNIKDIRENFDNFKKNLLKRNVQVNFDEIINLDKKNRELINIKEY